MQGLYGGSTRALLSVVSGRHHVSMSGMFGIMAHGLDWSGQGTWARTSARRWGGADIGMAA